MTRRTLFQIPLAAVAAPFADSPWLSDTFRMLHVDAHFASQPAPYADFDAEKAAEIIKAAGFQMVSVFAVCNRGMSYYPTKVGTVHPGLKRDFTGEFTRALKKRGMRVLAYVSIRECSPNLPQLQEIVDLYDVDGFFFDAVLKCSDISGVVAALKPGLAYFLNHLWVTSNPVNPPKALKTLVWEPVPPYTGVLSQDFSLEARYLPTVPEIENWSCMSTRGNTWGDYSIRERDTYLYEAAILLASGGRPYWGDVSYPSGNPEPELYKLWGEVNARTAALEPFVRNVKPVKEIAVLLAGPIPGVSGAHRALVEEQAQFSIVNQEAVLDEYKALIIPEQGRLSPAAVAAIRKFKGALIVTGEFDPALADVLGVKPLGRGEARRSFLRREYDVQVNGPYHRVELTTAKTLVELSPSGPGITLNGRAAYCAVEIFGAYQKDRVTALRRIVSWLLETVFPLKNRQIEVKNAPFYVEMSLNRRENDLFLHLLSAYPASGIELRVRSASRPKRVLTVPEQQAVAFEFKDGWTSFRAAPLHIHAAYQIEV